MMMFFKALNIPLRVVLSGLFAVGCFLSPAIAFESSVEASPLEPVEIISLRQENSKTFDLGDGTRQITSMGAIHYKDNYADSREGWKDIDLIWEGNRITKAPYELTLEGKKLTIRNKKTSEVSTIELLDIEGVSVSESLDWDMFGEVAKIKDIALDTDLEIVAENGAVKFTRILKSDKAPSEAKFKVTGNWRVRASDEEGDLPVVSTLKDGVLTEGLGLAGRPVKYPVRIDPTWQVGGDEGSTDDITRNTVTTDFFSTTYAALYLGYSSPSYPSRGSAARFLNVAI
ncbi:hypothetical protein LCGC14_0925910, partial [marine sediment metagenome]